MARSPHASPKNPVVENEVALPPSVLNLIVDQIHDGICLQDIHGRIEWVNPACEAMFGWRQNEIRGRSALEFITPPGKRKLGSESGKFIYDFTSRIFNQNIITEFQRRDGARIWVQQSFALLEMGKDETRNKVVITCRDVTAEVSVDKKLKQVHDNLEYAAHHDELTGMANRKKLGKFLRSDKVASAIINRHMGVLQIDVDKFKEINDTLGHAAGDETLRHVAKALRQKAGQDGLACRTGGDEFLLVCLASDTVGSLQECANALLSAINKPMRWKGQELTIGASIGASLANSPDMTGEDLIQQADKALYAAKRGGRGRVALYTDKMGQKYKAQMKLVRELKQAISENQFDVYLQPQMNLPSGQVTGCEALIRWNHPSRGLLSPGQFLPTAEEAGLGAEIDYISMNMALDAHVKLQAAGFTDLNMSINVSSSILGDVNYPGLLDWAMQSRDISAGDICIEILETTILDGGGIEIATAIEKLKRLGVRIALDDFGTGYAGLAHMSSFDVDVIKLDRSMISRLANDPRNRMVVRSVIRLCELLDISVVAEGVETNNQLEILRRAKCPLIQGFGLARPMAFNAALDWLKLNSTRTLPMTLESSPKAETIPLTQLRR